MIIIDSEWKKRLRIAEFRGVSFFIDSHDFEGGRNALPRETPDRDKNIYTEDIGRKAERFTINGHILGDNYFLVRDSLISALRKKGKGILKHPYLGIKEVQVDGFRFREDIQEGRIANFTISFVESGNPIFPESIFNAVAEFFNAANEAIDNIQTAFEAAYSVVNLPGFAVNQAINTVQNLGAALDDAIEKVNTLPDKLTEFKKLTLQLRDATIDLVRDPNGLSNLILGTVEAMAVVAQNQTVSESAVIDVTSGKNDQLAVYEPLFNFGDDLDNNENTPSQATAKKNDDALVTLVKQSAAINLAKISVAKQLPSVEEAIEQQKKVVDLIDDILFTTEDDASFSTLKKTSALFVESLPSKSVARTVTINTVAAMPSLALVYDAYESLDREQDFITRNKVRNPATVPAGDLVVLNG